MTVCGITTYPRPVPSPYRYFSDSQLAGVLEVADYCPFYYWYDAPSSSVCTASPSRPAG